MKSLKFWIGVGILILLYFAARQLYFKPTYASGDPAPVFAATLADGSPFTLEQFRGKYVLIDFWGSWCRPCIEDMPQLNALYQRFNTAAFDKGNGFEIVSIAVEKEENRWRLALLRYPMLWRYQILDQTSNLRFFNGQLTTQFRVKRLPSVFLKGRLSARI